MIERSIDIALIDIVAAIDHAGSVIGAKGDAALDVLEHLLELGSGASAGGAEHDAGLGELFQALIEALGQHTLVGQQRLVHIDGKDLDVADSGVRFVSLHKSAFPFLNCFGRNNPPVVIERIFAGLARVCITIHKVMKKLFRNLKLSLVPRAL